MAPASPGAGMVDGTDRVPDGRIGRGTDPAVRATRPISRGGGDGLFAGNKGGANRRAVVASLAGTAKRNDVDPFAGPYDSPTMTVDAHRRAVSTTCRPGSVERATAGTDGA